MTSSATNSSVSGAPPAAGNGTWRRWWIVALLAPLVLLSVYHFHYGLQRSYLYGYADFPIFAEQAHAYLQTGVLYPDAENAAAWEPGAHVFKYPPFYSVWLLPFVKEGVPQALYDGLWWIVLAVYFGCVALGIRLLPGRRLSLTALTIVLAALNFEPFLETLWHLQLETLFVLAFLLVLLAYRNGRYVAAGVLIGVCASLKVYPAFLLLLFAVRGSWRVVGSALATAMLCVTASYIIVGHPAHVNYFGHILPVMLGEGPSLIAKNQSLARYVVDLTGWSPEAGKRVAQLVGLGLVAWTVACVRRNRPQAADPDVIALQLAAFVGLMSLCMANFWSHYQVMLLFPFIVVLHAMWKRPSLIRPVGAMLAVAYAVTLFYSPCQTLTPNAPCAETPHVLGLFQLPRPLHDVLVYAKVLANVAAWLAPLILLWSWCPRPAPAEREAA